jgi:phosphoserine aminotransferase
MADLIIPPSMLPVDGRFGSGPSKVRPAAVDALVAAAGGYLGTSHRRPGVKSVVRQVRQGLSSLLGLPDGYEVVLGNGGATAFFDIATLCLIERRSQHLVFGEFSGKFAAAASSAPFLEEPVTIQSEPGTHPEPVADTAVDAYALTQNETSTGVMSQIRRPLERTGGDPAAGLVLVDATSAAGGLRVEAGQFDAYYFAPQKCLGSEGGLWLAALSPAAIERVEATVVDRWVPAVLDLKIAIDNSRLDQTYNTPALATLFLLASQLEWINGNGGLEWSASRCDRSAEIVYGWASRAPFATPFVAKPDDRSHVVATIDFDRAVDASAVAGVLRANGVLDTEPYRKLGRNQLRIAMFPGIEPDDLEALTACIDFVVEQLAP